MMLLRLLFVIVLNLLLGCASTPPTPIDSGVKQVEQGLEAAKNLPDNSPGKPAITNALEQCRANLPAYEAKVQDLTKKLETCNADRLSLSKSAGKGDFATTAMWMAGAAAGALFIKWILTKIFKWGA